ncbi:uncharacterized protein DNG_04115 [Cephalotrichum gorgonifer]|uniref:Uncharacterized protein n=1 Tax=Cephalotrichum gorgonifer TaxID=2041049 RepID=A0AAE8MWF0_9PEZI|nr:uncharacterized protein DNG_04115 [Cephalotrichum gorgonifer]
MPPKRKAKSPKRARWFPSPPKPKRMRQTEPSPSAAAETRQMESRPPAQEERPQTVVPENLEYYSSSDSSSGMSTIYNVVPQPGQPGQPPPPPKPSRRAGSATSFPCGYHPGAKVETRDSEPSHAATRGPSAGEDESEDYYEDSDAVNTEPDDDDNEEYYSASSSEESSSSEDSTSHSSHEHQPSSPAADSPGTPDREQERAKEPIRKHWLTCNTCERKQKRMGKETFDRLYGRGSEEFVDAAEYSGSEYDEDSEKGCSDGSESD